MQNTSIVKLAKKCKNNDEVLELVKLIINNVFNKISSSMSLEQKVELLSINPEIVFNKNFLKQFNINLELYMKYVDTQIEGIELNLLFKPYLIKMLKVREWMEKNNSNSFPRAANNRGNVPQEEAKYGKYIANIQAYVVKPYKLLKNEQEIKAFKRIHPESEIVVKLVDEIENKRIPIYLKNALQIRDWMKKNNTTIPPRAQNRKRNVPQEEAKLGIALRTIRNVLINKYKALQTEEERKEFLKKHPETEEVIKIITELDSYRIPLHLEHVLSTLNWMKKNNTTNLPRAGGDGVSKEEAFIREAFERTVLKLVIPYDILKTQHEKEDFIISNPEIEQVMQIIEEIENIRIQGSVYLRNMKNIKAWIEQTKGKSLPRWRNLKISEEEGNLRGAYYRIYNIFIKGFEKCKNDEERCRFKRKYPELYEIIKIFNEIEKSINENIIISELSFEQDR